MSFYSFGVIPSESYVYLIANGISNTYIFCQGISNPDNGIFQSTNPGPNNNSLAPVVLALKIQYDYRGVSFKYNDKYLSYSDGYFSINSINPQYFLLTSTGYNVNNSIIYAGLSYDFQGIKSFNYEFVFNYCPYDYQNRFACDPNCGGGKCLFGNFNQYTSNSLKFVIIPSEVYNLGTLSLPYKFDGTSCVADSNVKMTMAQNIRGNGGCSLENNLNCLYSNSADCFENVNTVYCSDVQVCSSCLGLCPDVHQECLFEPDYSSYFCYSETPPPTSNPSGSPNPSVSPNPSGSATPTPSNTSSLVEGTNWSLIIIIIVLVILFIVITFWVIKKNSSKNSS